MIKIKQWFCDHYWVRALKRRSLYVDDCKYFSDLGMYDTVVYVCKKCGKKRVRTEMNLMHPLYRPWERIEDSENNAI